jgi:hypothetical protein
LIDDDYDSQSEYLKYKNNRHKIVNLTNPIAKEEDNTINQKIKPKHGGGGQQVGKFFIKPLNNRKRKRSLGEEDLDDVATYFGSSGAGVSKVEDRTFHYQNGSWT